MTHDSKIESLNPHEGRELELMLAGSKPLSAFFGVFPGGVIFPEAEFDALVAEGRLIKGVVDYVVVDRQGRSHDARDVYYALSGEEWRIKAMSLVQEIYRSLLPGWRTDFERIIGALLGYERESTERFVALLPPART